MTQSKSKSALIISLITLIATCISGVLLINEKNVQLALTLMILPIALSSYLYPRYIYLVFLFITNILSVYLPGLMGIQFNVSAAELIVFNVVCISFSELIQQLKQSYSKANEKLSQLNFLHHNIVNKIKEGVTILKNDQAFFANDQISNLTGLSPEEIKSFSFLNLAHPEEKYKIIFHFNFQQRFWRSFPKCPLLGLKIKMARTDILKTCIGISNRKQMNLSSLFSLTI